MWGAGVSDAETYRRRSDELLRQAMKANNLSDRSQLISQAVHFNELAQTAERVAVEQRRAAATVVPFGPEAKAP
jgi:hypothetical protein